MAPQHVRDHDLAILDFQNAVKSCTVKTPDPPKACGRSYVRVTKFAEWWESQVLVRGISTTQASRLRDYAYRKRTGYGNTYHLTKEQLLHPTKRCILVFSVLLQIGWGDLIHLFRSHEKFDTDLPIELDSLKKTFTEISRLTGCPRPIPNPDELAAAFNHEQWQFCPATFDFGEKYNFYKDRIIPICDKRLINKKGGTAVLWQIEVLEEFISERLRDFVRQSRYTPLDDPADQLGPRYHFALKSFKQGSSAAWENEITAFNGLSEHSGMVRYLCGYHHEETEDHAVGGRVVDTHNILLEFGNCDLEDMFLHQQPPVLPHEIEAFWGELFHVANAVRGLHNLEVKDDGRIWTYHGWHADIKPDNILEIDGRFKLADPGFAKFLEKAKEKANSNPTATLSGGTYTYGAPERHPGRRDSGAVHQTIDVWSLGCVFSFAATWIALGSEGIKQYNKWRENAINVLIRARNSDKSNTRLPKLDPGDYFHDGLSVLPEVKSWHQYLRICLRRTDRVTKLVLDIVDEQMLIGDPKARKESRTICEELQNITNSLEESPLPVSNDVVEFLVKLNEEASLIVPITSTIATTSQATFSFEDRQLRKYVSLGVPLMKTAHRSYPRSSTTSPSVAEEPVIVGLDRFFDDPVPIPPQTPNERDSQAILPHGNPPLSSYLEASPEIQESTWNESSSPQIDSLYSLVTSPSRFSIPKPKTRHPAENAFQARENMENRKRRKRDVFRHPKPKDEFLAQHFEDRDIKFLVDNGNSMEPYWGQAKYLLETLFMKAEGLDEDGIDISFTQGSAGANHIKGKTKALDMMKLPQAAPMDGVHTDMTKSLQEIFDEFTRNAKMRSDYKQKLKKLTIIVLTDGIWAGTADKNQVAEVIKEFTRTTEKILGRRLNDRFVSIEFVQFGRDIDSTLLLKSLDDDLPEDGTPDLVDTEHCEGDVNKMLLGSFVPSYDALEEDYVDSRTITTSSPTHQSNASFSRMSAYTAGQPRHTPTPPGTDPFGAPLGYRPLLKTDTTGSASASLK